MDAIWHVSVSTQGIVGEILGYTTGLIISILFLRLIQQTSRSESGYGSRLAFALCALAFNGTGLVHKILLLGERSPYAPALQVTNFLLYAIGAIWPSIAVHLWAAAFEKNKSQTSLQKWLSPISAGSASALVSWLVIASVRPGALKYQLTIENLVLYHASLILILAFIAFRPQLTATHLAGRSLFVSVGGILGSTLVTQLLHLPLRSDAVITVLAFLKQQFILLAIVGALFLFARLRFTDVFARNALRVLIAELAAFILWMIASYTIPIQEVHARSGFHALTELLFLFVAGALFLGSTQINRFLDWFIGHTLFHEPDYPLSIKTLWQKLISLETEKGVLEAASAEVTHTLEIEQVSILPFSSIPQPLMKIEWLGRESYEPQDESESKQILLGYSVDLLIPLHVHGQIGYVMAVVSGKNRRSLLGSEVNYLRNIADLIGSRIEVLHLESQRMEQANRETKMLHQLTEAELRALRAQINPHFLFNALNMLAELICTAPEKAEEVTLRLSSVFRHVLRNSEKNLSQISEEIDFLRAYLSIEEARLEENLQVSIQVDPEIAREPIPSLLLQPLVENAIRHGLAPKLGQGRLHITARGEDDKIILKVEDNGVGTLRKQSTGNLDTLTTGSGGLGLRNTAERLRTFYNGQASMSFCSEPDAGSCVTISIPRMVNEYAQLT